MALDPQVAKANLVKAYRDLGMIQDSGVAPTATMVRRAEGRLNKALADFYEASAYFVIEEMRPTPTTP